MVLNKGKIEEQLRMLGEDLKKLKEKAVLSLEEYLRDEDSQDVVERRFQTAVETCINIGNYLITELELKMPADYASIFYSLSAGKVMNVDLADEMADLARFRNALVHLYWKIDSKDIYEKMGSRIQILQNFMEEIVSSLKI